MHFLSHFYTELPNENPLFVAALSIPDFANGFTRVYNSKLKYADIPEDENLQQIHSGIVQHYAGDKWFHASTLFEEQVSAALQFFLNENLNREKLRLSMIAHLAVEMMIDRQIILQHKDVCEKYYELLNAVKENFIHQYFALHSLEVAGQNFFSKFQFFKQKQFLFLFSELENIVTGLNRIYASVTKTEFTEEEKRKFVLALHNIDSALRYSWQEILNTKL